MSLPGRGPTDGPPEPGLLGDEGLVLPGEAFAAALAALPAMGYRRLASLLGRWSAEEVWDRLSRGRAGTNEGHLPPDGVASSPERQADSIDPGNRSAPDLAAMWRGAAEKVDVEELWRRHLRSGVGVLVAGTDRLPAVLAGDHQPPGVLFYVGDPEVIDGPRVGIVGTRRCSRYGRDVAFELGRDLADAGVRVVSGLASGVDGAAHGGALAAGAAPPVAVVGSGLDVVYPRRNAQLWADVAAAGTILSEAPLGAAPEPWRFPVRNRLIAALSDVLVVVESADRGGSRHTVDAAADRGRTVMAVPGPVRSETSSFTNALIADGCPPARDAPDVLVALGLSGRAVAGDAASRDTVETRPAQGEVGTEVLDVLGWEPASLEQVVIRSGRSPSEVMLALVHLERDGWVGSRDGWWERIA